MNTTPALHHSHTSDEIDLFTLFGNIWKQKLLISLVTLICLLAGIIFAFTSTPAYKASVNLKPIDQGTLKPLSSLTLYSEISSKPLLHELLLALQTTSLRQQFIITADKPLQVKLYSGSTTEQQLSELSKRFKLITLDTKKILFPYSIEFTAPSPKIATDELNRLIDQASFNLIENLHTRYVLSRSNELQQISQRIENIESKLATERTNEILRLQENHDLELKQLNDQLAVRKQAYLTKINDRIRSLNEAYLIAAALEIINPVALNQLAKTKSDQIQIISSGQNEPLYLRGTRLLGKEHEQLKAREDDYFPDETVRELETKIALMQHNRRIEMLASRKSDNPFSAEIQALKVRMHTIQSEVFPDELKLNFTASPAIAEASPIKPKKALIIALSLILGGMIGLMVALVRSAVLNRQKYKINNRHITD